jgi:hypothetical protein
MVLGSRLLNKESKKILSKIEEFKLPLTSIFESFKEGKQMGCGNCIDIKEHEQSASDCGSGRDHHGRKHPMFKDGKEREITRLKEERPFKLKVGR